MKKIMKIEFTKEENMAINLITTMLITATQDFKNDSVVANAVQRLLDSFDDFFDTICHTFVE